MDMNYEAKKVVERIDVVDNVAFVTIAGLPNDITVLTRIFQAIAKEKIILDMISKNIEYANKMSISFSMPEDDFVRIPTLLKSFKEKMPQISISANTANTKISIYGQGMNQCSGVASDVFDVFAQCGVDMRIVTTSEMDISVLVDESAEDEIVEKLKQKFQL